MLCILAISCRRLNRRNVRYGLEAAGAQLYGYMMHTECAHACFEPTEKVTSKEVNRVLRSTAQNLAWRPAGLPNI